MDIDRLKEKVRYIIKERFEASLIDIKEFRDELTIIFSRDKIKALCTALKEDSALNFDFLADITAIDYLLLERTPRFDVVYNLYSLEQKHRLRIKCPVPVEDPSIDSVISVWATANFLERETFDMFGIIFKGHPNLTRILMPDDWEGHPLRKDFPMSGIKSFYYKRDTQPFYGEPPGLVPRIKFTKGDVK